MSASDPGPGKILPEIDADNRRFWESCRAHAMELQRCLTCGRWRYFPSPICPGCSSFEVRWLPVSGLGTVFTCSILSRAASPAYRDDVPYAYAIVELDEAPMMPTNLVGMDLAAALHSAGDLVGLRVAVRYRDVSPSITLPVFAPMADERTSAGAT